VKPEIKDIKVGDRIVCRPLTRSGHRKITRTVTAILSGDSGQQVCIRHNGWSDFRLRNYEIIEVLNG